jgi:hypothetical protein
MMSFVYWKSEQNSKIFHDVVKNKSVNNLNNPLHRYVWIGYKTCTLWCPSPFLNRLKVYHFHLILHLSMHNWMTCKLYTIDMIRQYFLSIWGYWYMYSEKVNHFGLFTLSRSYGCDDLSDICVVFRNKQ